MKKQKRFLAFFFALTLLFSFAAMPLASENDARFATYINMGDNAVNNGYAIPNLFRQDKVFSNMQKFPLVVQNGVEYVPLSMFILYSSVEISYSKTGENFFLVNNSNNRYISFNVEEEIASTYDGDLLKLPVSIFNKTRYVPARTVAVVLGFVCETYDDPQKGIYAFRVSDGRSEKTLAQLIEPYIALYESAQEKVEPDTKPEVNPKPEVKPEQNPQQEIKPPSPPPAVQQDPLESVAQRRVSICYANASYQDTERILGVLDGYRIKASFSLTKDEILTNTALVRDIYLSGHSILVTANARGNTPEECAKSFVEGLEEANGALLKVLRFKTRMCTLPFDLPKEIADNEDFAKEVERSGYLILKPNTETGDGPDFKGSAYNVSQKIKNKISNGFNVKEPATVTALVWCSDKTQYYTADVGNYLNKYTQHKTQAMNEALLYNS